MLFTKSTATIIILYGKSLLWNRTKSGFYQDWNLKIGTKIAFKAKLKVQITNFKESMRKAVKVDQSCCCLVSFLPVGREFWHRTVYENERIFRPHFRFLLFLFPQRCYLLLLFLLLNQSDTIIVVKKWPNE